MKDAQEEFLEATFGWSKKPPTEPGYYWGILNNPDAEPVPVQFSGTQKTAYPVELMCSDEIFRLEHVKLWGPKIIPPSKP